MSERKIKPYFLATIVVVGDAEFPFEGEISKFFISLDAELPTVAEVQSDGRRTKSFWTYEEAESWLNENI